ncbi:hypothetical protein HMPREF3144_06550 [Oligella sp. HMSC05A10]|uniref:phage regulatory CII family protein n=1 Tax=Oligella sp. HMSC05A10 TaxID=1581112 RepID=UPI0008A3A605|nr:phage regulatory CII family protein [Oligella sp. HMSC05A10]OFS84500.1 hypothetical protein HMPREF3144_06550 [Oligella sp. HMSC05A10]
MSVVAQQQLTLDFTPGLTERHETMLDCVRECALTHRNPLKTIAADMDLSPTELSRKISTNPEDPRRFSLCDLERFIAATGDTRPIYWLIEKFLQDGEAKQKQAIAALANAMPEILALFKQASGQ